MVFNDNDTRWTY